MMPRYRHEYKHGYKLSTGNGDTTLHFWKSEHLGSTTLDLSSYWSNLCSMENQFNDGGSHFLHMSHPPLDRATFTNLGMASHYHTSILDLIFSHHLNPLLLVPLEGKKCIHISATPLPSQAYRQKAVLSAHEWIVATHLISIVGVLKERSISPPDKWCKLHFDGSVNHN